MEELTAAEAAAYLGVTREAVDAAARDGRLAVVAGGGPRRFSREAVEEFHQLRQAQLLATLARSGETPVSVAQRVRTGLHASAETGLPRSFTAKLNAMPLDWRTLFNRAELAAACLKDGEGCRWCKAVEFSAFLGLRPVEYGEARAELFGGPPCGTCAPGLLRPLLAALSARVHPGRHRPPDARAEAVAAVGGRLPAAARPQAAQPLVGNDDGRALVTRRRREVQARLTAARRSGDQRYAIQLRQTLQALTADAAVVDGRQASARPGTLRCGHLLAANCACPRIASKRSTS